MAFRVARDYWIASDKLFHLCESGFLFTLLSFPLGYWKGFLYNLIIQILWEVKDALVPWEKYKQWGGDGFSYKDLTVDMVGVGILVLARLVF